MTVTNVQDVMLAAVAVSGMGDDIPKADAQEPVQAPRKSAETAAEQAEAVAEQKEQHAPLSEEQTSFITQQLNEIMSICSFSITRRLTLCPCRCSTRRRVKSCARFRLRRW